jgi:segregation and condensation protein A
LAHNEPPVPADPSFRIAVKEFEGPLDLLLHLIQKHELDILDLPIAFVTERYLEYLSLMRELNLDVASEYLVMAAELARIKSKLLLPPSPDDVEEVEEDQMDPREELIRRLLEYQKYKKVAGELGGRELEGRDVFARRPPDKEELGPAPLREVSIFQLLDAFQGVVKRAKAELSLAVNAERITIQERITELTEALQQRGACRFESLFPENATTYDVVVTFLAILEMAKMGITRLYQADRDSPIHLELRLLSAEAPEETT